jgi:hypothetical protein
MEIRTWERRSSGTADGTDRLPVRPAVPSLLAGDPSVAADDPAAGVTRDGESRFEPFDRSPVVRLEPAGLPSDRP